MSDYDNTNTGSAFTKEGYAGQSGVLNVEGKEYWVNLYFNKKDGTQNVDKNGRPWTRIVIKPKNQDTAF